MPNANERCRCTVCNLLLSSKQCLQKHMLRYHPAEWVSQGGRQITYHPCSVQGCNRLNNNTRPDFATDHLSMFHGIDVPSRMRTTDYRYLKRKRDAVLKQHIMEEATELNELNTRIRHVECMLQMSHVTIDDRWYKSRHGFDLLTPFDTDDARLPKKPDLISHLQRIRNTRNEVGPLCTMAGEKDTRDGVLDELEMLMGWP